MASERELPILRDHLDPTQRSLLILDASQVARALVRLDDRYHNLPRWQLLGGRVTGTHSRPRRGGRTVRSVGLFSSALRCETWAAGQVTDASYTLDLLGHRPEPVIADRDLVSGIGDVITALANAWVRLHHEFPSMTSMTAILRINRLISGSTHRLALAVGEPYLADKFATRAATYLRLLDVTENVSGNLGRGQTEVADMTTAGKILDAETTTTREHLVALSRAFDVVDAGLSTLLERGANQRYYFVTHRIHLGQVPVKGIVPAVHRYVALTDRTHPAFFDAARELRPALRHREADASSVTGRESFRELIDTGFGRKQPAARPDALMPSGRARETACAVADTAMGESEIDDLEPDVVGLAM